MSLLENSQTPLLFLYFNEVEKTILDQLVVQPVQPSTKKSSNPGFKERSYRDHE